MKTQQLKWAAQHDWYVGHGVNAENELFIRVIERSNLGDAQLNFTDYEALRAWAGY